MKYLKWVAVALVFLWCLVIWQFSLAPAEQSASTSGEVVDFCNGVLESLGSDAKVTGHTVRKTAHFTEFLVLGVLVTVAFLLHGFHHWRILSPLVFLPAAVIDECIQFFVPNRGPSVIDVLIDCAGGLLGTVLFVLVFDLVYYIIIKRKKKIDKTS